jgi:hypothetical protein
MTEKYQHAKWPDDTTERILALRADGRSWSYIAAEFGVSIETLRVKAKRDGVLMAKSIRRLTPEEDDYIRQEWAKNLPLENMAVHLRRSVGGVRQRIFHRLSDLVGTRSKSATFVVKRYGREALELGKSPHEVRAAIASATAEAKHYRTKAKIEHLHAQIAAGVPRNEAIFEARCSGLTLERIAEEFDVTRERIRQIYQEVGVERALAARQAAGSGPNSIFGENAA